MEELALEGVWEDKLAALLRTNIDPGWLDREVIFDLKTAALHEKTPDGPKHGERRFSDIRVYPRRHEVDPDLANPSEVELYNEITEPPGGLDAHSAFLEFTESEKLEACECAAMAVRPDPRFEHTGFLNAHSAQGESWEDIGPSGKRRRRHDYKPAELEAFLIAKRHARDARKPACRDFGDKLRSGEIVAFGSLYPAGATERSRIDSNLWDVLRARTRRAWHRSRFSGGGHTFHDVRFHDPADLKVWRDGAPLVFAIRALEPLGWANYQANWSPAHAPKGLSRKDRQLYGESDRVEFWRLLLDSFSEHGLELQLLSPAGHANAEWTKVSPAVEERLKEAEMVDLERSTVALPGVPPMPARVVVVNRFIGVEIAGSAEIKRDLAGEPAERQGAQKSPPRRKAGRPTDASEIKAAFERLRDNGSLGG